MTIHAQPEATYEASLEGAPTGLTGTLGVQVINPPAGTVMTARTTAGIVEQPAGSGIYHTVLTAPTVLDTYSVVWDTGTATPTYASEDLVVSGFAFPTSTFATVADVRARCDNPAEDPQVEYLLDEVTALILEAVDKDFDWLADDDSTIPPSLRFLCARVVCRLLAVPAAGVASTREQLGEYSYSQNFSGDGGDSGLELTEAEVLKARRAVWGTTNASPRMGSVLDDLTAVRSDAYPWD